MNPSIFPVIHHRDDETTTREVALAKQLGANGVFLISHGGGDKHLAKLGGLLKAVHGDFFIGANFLNTGNIESLHMARAADLDGLWLDAPGITSAGVSEDGRRFLDALYEDDLTDTRAMAVFASVAFKYQPIDLNPAMAARFAAGEGLLPTTSGTATGSAPEVEKIASMAAVSGWLAIASGMTPENIHLYAPYLSAVLVSTGINKDGNFYEIDPKKLTALIANSKEGAK